MGQKCALKQYMSGINKVEMRGKYWGITEPFEISFFFFFVE